MSRNELLGGDSRPRVHVWKTAHPATIPTRKFSWSHGPTGLVRRCATVGECAEDAAAELQGRPFVMLYEGERA